MLTDGQMDGWTVRRTNLIRIGRLPSGGTKQMYDCYYHWSRAQWYEKHNCMVYKTVALCTYDTIIIGAGLSGTKSIINLGLQRLYLHLHVHRKK